MFYPFVLLFCLCKSLTIYSNYFWCFRDKGLVIYRLNFLFLGVIFVSPFRIMFRSFYFFFKLVHWKFINWTLVCVFRIYIMFTITDF